MDDTLPQWAPPTSEPVAPTAPPRRRGWFGYLLVLGLVAGLLAIWALGGFAEHVRINHPTTGQSVDLGPATVSVDRVVARKGFTEGWDIRAYGACQVDAGSNLDLRAAASVGDLFGMAEDIPQRTASETTTLWLDPQPGEVAGGRDYLSPGLEPMSCAFQGHLPDSFNPEHKVLVQFVNLEFRDTSVTQNQDPVWTGGTTYYRYSVPVEVVTDW